MRFHQVLVGASPGDAITNIALAVDDLVQRTMPTTIWAHHLERGSDPRIRHMPQITSPDAADVVLYHHSIGEPEVVDWLVGQPARVLAMYHNVTPARFFEDLDPTFAQLLRLGRDELGMIAERADLVIVASQYSADEVRQACSDATVRVVPYPLEFDALTHVDAHEPTLRHFREVVQSPLVIAVGQLLPHKRPDVLIGAMHALALDFGIPAELAIVGPERNPRYARAVHRYVEDLGLANVWVTGRRTVEELAAFYRSASLLVSASEHEGFCVPVVEAYHFDLPVIARSVAALPETVGSGGLLLPPDAGPSLYAEALAAVLTDDDLAARLRAGGRLRREELSTSRVETMLMATIVDAIAA